MRSRAKVRAEPRADDQGLATSYVASDRNEAGRSRILKAYFEPLLIGSSLPPVPLFLSPGESVDVPLDETYMRAFAGLGRSVKRTLA